MMRSVSPGDAAAICSIYNYYVENTAISFEETPVSTLEMEERINNIRLKYPYFVWEEDGEINGYVYANKWRDRSAYRYSAEVSIYLRNGFQGRGIGRTLMEKLITEIRKTDIHSLVSGITLPNPGSIALHEKLGFKKIAQFEEIGFKFNKWLDVGYWQLSVKKEQQ